MNNKLKEINVVDLFCGIGGLSHGLVKEGINVVAGIDVDNSCKYAFETNNRSTFLNYDVDIIHHETIKELYPKKGIKVLVGCAPCQPFSSYNLKKDKDKKWKLLYGFSRLIKGVKPDIVSMENVPQLLKHNNGKILLDFVTSLKEQKYHVWYDIVDAQNYKVPQRRKRLVLLASKFGPINLIAPQLKPGKFISVRKAIGDLPEIEDGISHEKDRMHRARKLSPLNKKRIQATPPNGSWKDWPSELLLECHKKESGKTFGSVYGRMDWNKVSPTLTTQCTGLGNGRFGHPDQDRAISLREAAILQSFPKRYKFFNPKEPMSTPKIEKHIGNSVPVKLGQAIGKSILLNIEEYARK